jgi:hypothetical protein
MKIMRFNRLIFALLPIVSAIAGAQDSTAIKKPKKLTDAFFHDSTPLAVTLTLNMKQVRGDRGDSVPWRDATLTSPDATGELATIPIKVKTRGIWRRKKCDYPPLRLNFGKSSAKRTVFQGLNKPKLVVSCRDNALHEEYLLSEFQLYRVFQQLTPNGHKVRLLQLSFVDSASGKLDAKRYAFIEEEPAALASRVGGQIVPQKGAKADDVDDFGEALYGLFEYMIGNTDISITALHNSELLSLSTGFLVPIPYDFDFSGIVNTSYATAAPGLNLASVRDRSYRGWCVPDSAMTRTVELFNSRKNSIVALYSDQLGKLLNDRRRTQSLEYIDDFYHIINDKRQLSQLITGACLNRLKSDAPPR